MNILLYYDSSHVKEYIDTLGGLGDDFCIFFVWGIYIFPIPQSYGALKSSGLIGLKEEDESCRARIYLNENQKRLKNIFTVCITTTMKCFDSVDLIGNGMRKRGKYGISYALQSVLKKKCKVNEKYLFRQEFGLKLVIFSEFSNTKKFKRSVLY